MEGLEAGEIEDGDEKGDNLAQNGRDGCTAHTHIKDKDEDGVKYGVDDGTEQHGDHGEFGTAVRTNHGVECGRDHGEGQADGDGEDDVCCTVSQISDTPANKNLVDDVVECVYYQRNDTGDGEFDDQPTHRFGCKRTFVLIRSVFHL